MSLPPWPSAARHIITGISKADREMYDEDRCGPVYHESYSPLLTLEWNWCNKGFGTEGHLPNPPVITRSGGGTEVSPFCMWCGGEM